MMLLDILEVVREGSTGYSSKLLMDAARDLAHIADDTERRNAIYQAIQQAYRKGKIDGVGAIVESANREVAAVMHRERMTLEVISGDGK